MTLAEILTNNRKIKNISVRKAAKEIGVSFGYLSDLENGRRVHPKMKHIHRIAEFYEINEDDLCIAAERIPSVEFWKVVKNPELLKIIRNYPV